jgi:hypothetical protein
MEFMRVYEYSDKSIISLCLSPRYKAGIKKEQEEEK